MVSNPLQSTQTAPDSSIVNYIDKIFWEALSIAWKNVDWYWEPKQEKEFACLKSASLKLVVPHSLHIATMPKDVLVQRILACLQNRFTHSETV